MFFLGVGTSVPSKRYTQKECWDVVRRAPQFSRLKPRSKATLQHVLCNAGNGISARHLALDPLGEVFETDPDTLAARFARHAPQLAVAAARLALRDADLQARDIDAVLVSTCTGYLCPGLTGYVSERIGLRADVLGLDLVGQGCAAALPNLRTAESLIAAKRCGFVLSICVEVCSAAFYIDDDTGVLISACLFGDGAGAAILAAQPRRGRRQVQWKGAWSLTEPAHRDALRFEQRGGMLRNILTPQVPALAGQQAALILASALRDARLAQQEIRTWIWHAGGQRVLEQLCAAARLEAADVERSARVLSEFGNLSSPFVYFVLELALRERAPDGWWWLASFGAGFSCHGALLAIST
jgi:predicted naringenin-chalcone synthase